MNIKGRIAERITGYLARWRSISASTSGEKVAISSGICTGCDKGAICVSSWLISYLQLPISNRQFGFLSNRQSEIGNRQSTIDLPQHNIQRSNNRHDVRDHRAVRHVRQRRKIHKAWPAEVNARRLRSAGGFYVNAKFAF